jgi:hypothetical protein
VSVKTASMPPSSHRYGSMTNTTPLALSRSASAAQSSVRSESTGTAVTNLRVAVTQRIQQDGEWRDGDTSFFKVNVWRGQAEHLADSLSKGDRSHGRERQTEPAATSTTVPLLTSA